MLVSVGWSMRSPLCIRIAAVPCLLGLLACSGFFSEDDDTTSLHRVDDTDNQVGDLIRSLPNGGSNDWDPEIKSILLEAYDTDASGALNTPSEIARIPCDTWDALDESVRAGWGSGIRVIYGFKGEFIYAGFALGIDEVMRPLSDRTLSECGISDE